MDAECTIGVNLRPKSEEGPIFRRRRPRQIGGMTIQSFGIPRFVDLILEKAAIGFRQEETGQNCGEKGGIVLGSPVFDQRFETV